MFLVDFFSHFTTPAQIRATGASGLSAYVSHDSTKNSTAQELWAMHDDGLIVALNFEDSATNALGGYSDGQRDAYFVLSCLAALPYPESNVIAFSVDFDMQPYQYSAVIDYFSGALAEINGAYQVTDYGGINCVNLMHDIHGLYGWQTTAWSAGKLSPYAYAYQNSYGQQFDFSRLLFNVPMWGLDPIPNKPPMPKPKPIPTPGDDMYYVVKSPTKNAQWLICPNVTRKYIGEGDAAIEGAKTFGGLRTWPADFIALWDLVGSGPAL